VEFTIERTHCTHTRMHFTKHTHVNYTEHIHTHTRHPPSTHVLHYHCALSHTHIHIYIYINTYSIIDFSPPPGIRLVPHGQSRTHGDRPPVDVAWNSRMHVCSRMCVFMSRPDTQITLMHFLCYAELHCNKLPALHYNLHHAPSYPASSPRHTTLQLTRHSTAHHTTNNSTLHSTLTYAPIADGASESPVVHYTTHRDTLQ
jgi:hypothetical protein